MQQTNSYECFDLVDEQFKNLKNICTMINISEDLYCWTNGRKFKKSRASAAVGKVLWGGLERRTFLPDKSRAWVRVCRTPWIEEYITYKDNRKFSDLKKYFLKFKMLAGTCWNPIIQLTINLYFCPYRGIHHEMKIATTLKL